MDQKAAAVRAEKASDLSRDTVRSAVVAALVRSPDRLVLVFGAVFLAASAAAALSAMVWWVFVPLASVLIVVGWRWLPTPLTVDRHHLLGAAVMIILVLGWLAFNMPFASEYVVPIRDPGVYMVTGAVVAQTGGTTIDVTLAQRIVEAVDGLSARLGAFGPSRLDDSVIQLQGSSGFPALLAIGYWIGGVHAATAVNLVIGAVCLIAVYGLARRIVGPLWGIAPATLLAISMPFVYLSRTSYTEIITTLVIVASGTWIISAFLSHRRIDFAVAGLFIGMASLARIDGALAFAGALAGFFLLVLGIGRDDARRIGIDRILIFIAVGWALVGLGVLDLVLNQPSYVRGLLRFAAPVWALCAVLTLVLVVMAVVPKLRRVPIEGRPARRLAIVAAVIVAVVFVYWISRPAWMINRFISSAPYQGAIESLQRQDGLTVDPSRSYDEYTVWWFAWYFGWVLVIVAVAGLCWWIARAVLDREPGWVVVLTVAMTSALLYFNTVRVTPDQVWAFRRVLPSITPVLLIAFIIAVVWLWNRGRRTRMLAIAVLGATLLSTVLPWGRNLIVVEGGDQATEIAEICERAETAELLVVYDLALPPNYAATLRGLCGKELVTVAGDGAVDLTDIGALVDGDVAVVTFDAAQVSWTVNPDDAGITTAVRLWNRHLLRTPRTTSLSVRTAYVGILADDGRVRPVTP